MLELLNTELGVAILTIASGLIGAVIAIGGNVVIENMKYRKAIKDDMRERELEAYSLMLATITLLVVTKRNLNTVLKGIEFAENGSAILGDESIKWIYGMFNQNDEMARNALSKASMYSDSKLLEEFLIIYKEIQQDNELVIDITEEGLEKFNTHYNIKELEDGIRKRIKELKEELKG